ncbi:MAG: DUF3043 domain-containing protein [Nocardiopsaceae bacterium]|nr:DUF3043 domain-containing protein [Nocardiopsaceae bacterium]
MFRRSSTGEIGDKAADGEAAQAEKAPVKTKPPEQVGKGRPTPKRSEAERGRYRSIQGGTTSGRAGTGTRDPRRKLTPEEKAQEKERSRAAHSKRMEAMRKGEDWALLPRDRGPLKKLARDYVDSRRRASEFYMYALPVLLATVVTHDPVLEDLATPLVALLVAVLVIDGFFIRRSLFKLAAERYPGESTRGLTPYVILRAMQIRQLRNPKPRLRPGDKL